MFTKMKKLNKLEINSEKIMKNEELVTLRGGYGENCPCGTGVENWWAEVWMYGYYCFSGYACGTETYIRSIYSAGQYDLRLTGPFQDCF